MLFRYKKEYKIFLYVFFFTIIILFSIKLFNPRISYSENKILKGYIDLSIYNFSSNSLSLNGEWEFYENEVLYSSDLNSKKEIVVYKELFKSWKILHQNLSTIGTYKATIKRNENFSSYGIKINNFYSNYNLYINGKKINESFENPDLINNEDYKGFSNYHFFEVNQEDEYIEIIIQVTNNYYFSGWVTTVPYLGSYTNIHLFKYMNMAFSVFVLASLFLISVFLFSFYIAKNEENALIYLGICALCYTIKILIGPSGPMYFLYYSIPNLVLLKILVAAGAISVYFLTLFFVNVFKNKNINLNLFLTVCLTLYLIFISFNNFNNEYLINIVTLLLSCLMYVTIFLVSFKNLIIYRQKAIFNFSGSIIFVSSFFIDTESIDVSSYRITTLFIFCFFVIYQIISDYVQTYKNLKEIKKSLELEVEKRTIELLATNQDLKDEIKARRLAEENLRNIPNYNIQTGLFNQAYAINYIKDLISIFKRHNHIFSIMIIRIDNLKYIEKNFGKNLKSKTVDETIQVIKFIIRRTDLLTSWNNEKFIILMPNCLEKNAIYVANKLSESIDANIIDGYGNVSISYGISTIIDGDNIDSLVNRAEKELELNKNRIGFDKFLERD